MPQPAQTRPHLWVVGPMRRDRAEALREIAKADVTVDCHRGLRGPYTGVGSALRTLIPDIAAREPALLKGYIPAILCAAPELEPWVGTAPETLTALAPQDERTRWYSIQRTQRIANNLVELLRDCGETRPGGMTLQFDTVHEADPTDREFLAIALRRLDPAAVRLILGSAAGPDDPADGALTRQLARRAQRIDATTKLESASAPPEGATGACAYVAEDGAGDDPVTLAAYNELTAAERERLHDARAEQLEATGEYSLRLGAIPYHRHRGSDPIGTAWPLYAAAEGYCMSMGYYHAVLEYLDRLEDLVAHGEIRHRHLQQHAGIRRGQILALMGDPEGGEANYLQALALTRVPRQVMSLHYALGMLYTRWQPQTRRDHDLATAHLNTAVAIGSQLEQAADRAFHTAFMSNGLALARMHAGCPEEALDLVEGALILLNRELVADKHLLHRSVLRHNRSQLLAAMGRRDEALADMDQVVELDPHYPEYHFDRGNLRFQNGDASGALADYDHAETLGPPFPELFHNRAEVLLATGDPEGAVRSLERALELDPDSLESLVSLASLLLDAEPADDRRAEAVVGLVRQGLEANPDQPRLLYLLGRALAEAGRTQEAETAFDTALNRNPALYQALVARAVLAFSAQRYNDALADLNEAVAAADDDPDLLYNRGSVHETLGDFRSALEDYQRALALPDCDTELLEERSTACRKMLS
jgi:tetratricopeptide (TPR) repeat protein